MGRIVHMEQHPARSVQVSPTAIMEALVMAGVYVEHLAAGTATDQERGDVIILLDQTIASIPRTAHRDLGMWGAALAYDRLDRSARTAWGWMLVRHPASYDLGRAIGYLALIALQFSPSRKAVTSEALTPLVSCLRGTIAHLGHS